MATNLCLRCGQAVPPGRRYCTAHYANSLEIYQELSLDDGGRVARRIRAPPPQPHTEAGHDVLDWYALAFGLMAGGSTWLALRMRLHWDDLHGVAVLAGCVVASTLFAPIRRLVGRLMRTLLRGALFCGLLTALVWLLSRISQVADARSPMLYGGAIALGTLISVYAELSGSRNDSA